MHNDKLYSISALASTHTSAKALLLVIYNVFQFDAFIRPLVKMLWELFLTSCLLRNTWYIANDGHATARHVQFYLSTVTKVLHKVRGSAAIGYTEVLQYIQLLRLYDALSAEKTKGKIVRETERRGDNDEALEWRAWERFQGSSEWRAHLARLPKKIRPKDTRGV
jgi:hypothetical protein